MSQRTGAQILAVEDEARNGALLQAILVPAGYDLTIAATLAEARASLREKTPAIVLLDRHLPDGDGLDLARDLRASEATAAIPILLVSASVLPIDRTAAEGAGCAGFIDKPVRVDALLAEVARHLAAAERAPRARGRARLGESGESGESGDPGPR